MKDIQVTQLVSRRIEVEFFDKNLNGTVCGKFKLKEPIILDSSKKPKLATQLRNIVKKRLKESLYDKRNSFIQIKLLLNNNNVTTLINISKWK